MTINTLQNEIEDGVIALMGLAKEVSLNSFSNNYKFILTEIKDIEGDFYEQRVLRNRENDKKVPMAFSEIVPILQSLYNNLYDINLYIYKAEKHITLIDIRYYQKSSLDIEYRQTVLNNPPMLHCKVEQPLWLTNKTEKFDINWGHKKWLSKWKIFWLSKFLNFNSIKIVL